MNTTYKLSGAMGLGLLLPILVVPLAVLLGAAYSYADIYDPSVYLNLLVVTFTGIGAGCIPWICAKVLKTRNLFWIQIMGLFSGFITWYSSWLVFSCHMLNSGNEAGDTPVSLLDLVLNPTGLWKVIQYIGQNGWFQVSSRQVIGVELWIYWALEAATIILLSVGMAHVMMKSEVYCEECGQWAAEIKNFLRLKKPASGDGKALLAHQGASGLLAFSPNVAEPDESWFLRVNLRECKKCNIFRTMNVEEVNRYLNNKNKMEEKSTTLASNLLLGGNDYEALKKLKTT
jgi:hypothetical protein